MSKGGKNRQRDSGTEQADAELRRFFASEYGLGVHCSLGHAGSGGGGSSHDGWNGAVSFGVPGPAGYLEFGKVIRALRAMGGDAPPHPKMSKRKRVSGFDHERVARWKRTCAEWPLYLPALARHYRPRPNQAAAGALSTHDTYAWLIVAFDKLTELAPLTSTALDVTIEWMRRECEREVRHALESAALANEASEDRMDRNYVHDRLERKRMEIFYAFAVEDEAKIDLEGNVRVKWARSPLPSDFSAALAELAKQTQNTDRAARERADEKVRAILGEAERVLESALRVYVNERKKIDREIWDDHNRMKATRRSRAASYEASLAAKRSSYFEELD